MFFWADSDFKGFLENFAFHRLLAEQALQFLDLVLKGAILGSRNDLFLRRGGGQCPLSCKLAPIEQLVRLYAVTPGNDANRHAWLIRLLNDGQLFGRRPATRRSGPERTSIFGL
ncbi:hypothetical protein AJ87_23585 [Rhizobium yanglingense]|nr:hypothetical protein AJ87_23585 [Rhizobium yanglingense]